MEFAEVIIVGGGPAGSSCAWKLREQGIEVILLDKQSFPRSKPCAGWITPRVLRNLHLNKQVYSHCLTHFDRLHVHYRGREFGLRTSQYAIRRIEFDEWLLRRSGVAVFEHNVQSISRQNGHYVLDDSFSCRYLVGAGGTHCPVYRTLFKQSSPRAQESQIVALEAEFAMHIDVLQCHLWFADEGIDGYSWYVPKADGYVNIGIGAKAGPLNNHNQNIRELWSKFVLRLLTEGFLLKSPPAPQGYTYYLRSRSMNCDAKTAFIIGDSAGLATKDMGEGIGPAVESGIRAAEAIIKKRSYSISSIRKYSFRDLLIPARLTVE